MSMFSESEWAQVHPEPPRIQIGYAPNGNGPTEPPSQSEILFAEMERLNQTANMALLFASAAFVFAFFLYMKAR